MQVNWNSESLSLSLNREIVERFAKLYSDMKNAYKLLSKQKALRGDRHSTDITRNENFKRKLLILFFDDLFDWFHLLI